MIDSNRKAWLKRCVGRVINMSIGLCVISFSWKVRNWMKRIYKLDAKNDMHIKGEQANFSSGQILIKHLWFMRTFNSQFLAKVLLHILHFFMGHTFWCLSFLCFSISDFLLQAKPQLSHTKFWFLDLVSDFSMTSCTFSVRFVNLVSRISYFLSLDSSFDVKSCTRSSRG